MGHRKEIKEADLKSPDRILSNLIDDYITGQLDDYDFLYRALVVKVDHEGRKA